MEYKVNTSFNIGDKLYSLNSKGTILEYHISKIDFTGTVKDDYDLDIRYTIANSLNKTITRLSAYAIAEHYFTSKKDIVKYITDQL